MIMMKFVALTTKGYGLKTTVSLNALMVDGTGMCGACRVSVGGKTYFTCVDGPEFDAHKVDFDEAMRRQGMYRTQEERARAIADERLSLIHIFRQHRTAAQILQQIPPLSAGGQVPTRRHPGNRADRVVIVGRPESGIVTQIAVRSPDPVSYTHLGRSGAS